MDFLGSDSPEAATPHPQLVTRGAVALNVYTSWRKIYRAAIKCQGVSPFWTEGRGREREGLWKVIEQVTDVPLHLCVLSMPSHLQLPPFSLRISFGFLFILFSIITYVLIKSQNVVGAGFTKWLGAGRLVILSPGLFCKVLPGNAGSLVILELSITLSWCSQGT